MCCVADGRGRERCAEGRVCQPRQHHGQLPEGEGCTCRASQLLGPQVCGVSDGTHSQSRRCAPRPALSEPQGVTRLLSEGLGVSSGEAGQGLRGAPCGRAGGRWSWQALLLRPPECCEHTQPCCRDLRRRGLQCLHMSPCTGFHLCLRVSHKWNLCGFKAFVFEGQVTAFPWSLARRPGLRFPVLPTLPQMCLHFSSEGLAERVWVFGGRQRP